MFQPLIFFFPYCAIMPLENHHAPELKEFTDDTTIHGVKDVATGRSPLSTAVWALLLLGSTGAMILEIRQIVAGWQDRPKATQIKQLFRNEYPFPLMLFCPLEWINASRVRELNLTKEDVTYVLSFMPMLKVQYQMNVTNETIDRFDEIMSLHNFTHPFDLLYAISVDSQEIMKCSTCKSSVSKKKLTENGICFKLDLKDARRYYVDDFLFMPYFQYNPAQKIDSDESLVPPYGTYSPSEILYVGINENDFFDGGMERLKQNTSYLVKIAPRKQKRLNADGQSCLTEEAFHLKNLSQEMCFCDCEQRAYGPNCWGFVHMGYFYGPEIRTKTNETVPYWSALIHNSIDPSVWSECQGREKIHYDKCAAKCLPECEEWIYDTTVLTVNGRRLMTHTPEASITVVFSYQVKSGTILLEEKATYTWHSLVSNVGGQMGLWMGMSVLSICQMVFFAFRWIEYRLQMRAEEVLYKKNMSQFKEKEQKNQNQDRNQAH